MHSRRTEFDVREVPRKQGYLRHVWSPDQATVTHVAEVSIGLTVFETTEFVELVNVGNGKYVAVRDLTPAQNLRFKEPYYWRTTRELPTGRLAVQAYATTWRALWIQRWIEAKPGEFGSLVRSTHSRSCGNGKRLKRDRRGHRSLEECWERYIPVFVLNQANCNAGSQAEQYHGGPSNGRAVQKLKLLRAGIRERQPVAGSRASRIVVAVALAVSKVRRQRNSRPRCLPERHRSRR